MEVLVPQETQAVTEQPTVGMVLPTLLSPMALMAMMAIPVPLDRLDIITRLLTIKDLVVMVVMPVMMVLVAFHIWEPEVEVVQLLFINVPLHLDAVLAETEVLATMEEEAVLR